VVLITFDGLRWQELFQGADQRLLEDEAFVRDRAALRERFWDESPTVRRERLMPFFWQTICAEGQLFGDPDQNSLGRVTNGQNFSYPGYNELLTGFADERIDSNDKRPNPNVTVLEWLHQQDEFRGRVAAVASWDVVPFIINDQRSGIPVNAGWTPLAGDTYETGLLKLADELPKLWPNERYDFFTFTAGMSMLKEQRPRVLYVMFGETDDWAHEGRYDLYLDAAYRNDQYAARIWNYIQSTPEYAGKTTLVLTTDHGRGDIRDGWKSHGKDYPGSDRIWMAILGPDTPALGIRRDVQFTQGQTAATCALLLGEDYCAAEPKAAPPLPGILAEPAQTP
jgi:hypothetical protein